MKRILLTIIMATVVLAGCGTKGEEQSQNTKTTKPAQTAVDTPINKEAKDTTEADLNTYVFDMTTGDFTEAFNTVAQRYKLDYLKISDLKPQFNKNNVLTFQHAFNEDLHMIGTINTELKVSEVMVLGKGDLRNKTGEKLFAAIGTLIMTTNNKYTSDDAQEVLKDIGLFDKDINLQHFNKATVRNGIKYRLGIQDKTTVVFDITPAK
ncbi:MAG: lipoprotein [Bacillota bacterium]